MQPTTAGSSGSSGGGGGLSRAGLGRFSSAPATWLEALLEDDEEGDKEEDDDPLKKYHCLTQLLVGNSAAPAATTRRNSASFHSAPDPDLFDSSSTGLRRQNSSTTEFLANPGNGSDGYFSNFGIPTNYDYLSPNIDDSSSGKRPREVESQQALRKYPAQLKQEQGNQVPGGVSSLIDMEMEKLLEDSVPCRVRAKRGCATHPRSIAERIRKLQDLVPDMDKQTNTADMLEEAVEYVKFLQRQIQELSEHQKKCKCIPRD